VTVITSRKIFLLQVGRVQHHPFLLALVRSPVPQATGLGQGSIGEKGPNCLKLSARFRTAGYPVPGIRFSFHSFSVLRKIDDQSVPKEIGVIVHNNGPCLIHHGKEKHIRFLSHVVDYSLDILMPGVGPPDAPAEIKKIGGP